MFGFSFASDWLREWRAFSGPITERGEAKSQQSWKTFDTQLKMSLLGRSFHSPTASLHPGVQTGIGENGLGELTNQ